jgi:hypothetical protein
MSDYTERWLRKRLLGIEYLGGSCCECGNDNEVVLQFDHIIPTDTYCSLPKLSIIELYHELDKCELVCANCHQIRTKSREQHQHKNVRRNIKNAGDSYKRHWYKRIPEALNTIKIYKLRDGVCSKGHLNPPIDKHGRCLLCYREWAKNYTKTGTERYKLKLNRKNISRQKAKHKAIEYLGGKCCNCGIEDQRVFEFDHITQGPHIAKCMDLSWERLKIELDKCELVCANCHCIRTRARVE